MLLDLWKPFPQQLFYALLIKSINFSVFPLELKTRHIYVVIKYTSKEVQRSFGGILWAL